MKNLVTSVVKCKNFLLEAGMFHGYSLVIRWLLVHALLKLFDADFHEVSN